MTDGMIAARAWVDGRRFLAGVAGVAGAAGAAALAGLPEGQAVATSSPAGDLLWHDAWDGFPAARNRLTEAWVRHQVSNPVVVTGDWHSTFANDILRDFDDPSSPVVASEIVGTSISSNGDGEVYGPYYGPMIRFDPHIKFFDGDRRGYVRCRVEPAQMQADLRVVSTVSRPDAPESTFASFIIENGRPGPQIR